MARPKIPNTGVPNTGVQNAGRRIGSTPTLKQRNKHPEAMTPETQRKLERAGYTGPFTLEGVLAALPRTLPIDEQKEWGHLTLYCSPRIIAGANWEVGYSNGDEWRWIYPHDNPAEAAALLYLRLAEEGLLSPTMPTTTETL